METVNISKELLLKAIYQLEEVRTGTDFEVECGDIADELQCAVDRNENAAESKERRCACGPTEACKNCHESKPGVPREDIEPPKFINNYKGW